MSERYIKVFTGNENLYSADAPVIIRASALLKDTVTGKMIAQLKLQNISGKSISYVKVAVTQLDAVKNSIGKVISYEYLDISVSDREEFGSKNAISLSESSARSFCVGVSHVGFSDGTVWTSDNVDWQSADENSDVAKLVAAEDTYKSAIALAQKNSKEDVQKAKELYESISQIKDVTIEIDMCDKKLAEFDAKEAEKVKKKKKRRKAFGVSVIVVVIAAVLALVGYFAGYPFVAAKMGDYTVYINMYKVKEFEVPKGTKAIKDDAFYNCESLTSVTIPDSVTSIGNYAFSECSSLTSVTIPDSVTSIGNYAFSECSSLTSVTIPDSVKSIGICAFSYSSITTVSIPAGVTSIGDSAFASCFSLRSVTIPDSVESIGNNAFSWCDYLESNINYTGTSEQWRNVDKGYEWYNYVDNYGVKCSDCTVYY